MYDVALSPTGDHALTAGYEGYGLLWETRTGLVIQRFGGHEQSVSSVGFSRDGRRALTCSSDSARLWDVASGELVWSIAVNEPRRVTSAAVVGAAGETVAVGMADGRLTLYSTGGEGAALREFLGHTKSVDGLEVTADGRHLVSGSYDKTARLWGVESGDPLQTYGEAEITVADIALSPDEERLLIRDWGPARVFETHSGVLVGSVGNHGDEIAEAAFSSDGRSLIYRHSMDDKAYRWHFETDQVHPWNGPVPPVTARPDGSRAVHRTEDGGLEVRDPSGSLAPVPLRGRIHWTEPVAVSAGGRWLTTGSKDGTVWLWDLAQRGSGVRLAQPCGSTISLAFTPDGEGILAGCLDEAAHLVSTRDGSILRTYDNQLRSVRPFLGDGRFLCRSVEVDGLFYPHQRPVDLWDVETDRSVLRTDPGLGHPYSVGVSQDGTRALMSGYAGSLSLWDLETGEQVRHLSGHGRDAIVYSIDFSPDGRFAVTGANDGTARVWDLSTGDELRRFGVPTTGDHFQLAFAVAFLADGRRVMVASRWGRISIYDVESGDELSRVDNRIDKKYYLALAGEDRFLIAGGLDGSARVLDVETGRPVLSLYTFHDGGWAAIDPQGRYDGSDRGAVAGLHWVAGGEPIALPQLKERYHEPFLVRKILQGEPLRDVEALRTLELHPETALVAPDEGGGVLGIQLTDRGGGIGRVQVFVNGKEIAADARGPSADPQAGQLDLSVDLTEARGTLPGEENEVRVVAWNRDGYLSGRGAVVPWRAPGRRIEAAPELWAVVGGVSDYDGEGFDLRYAGRDARDFATALEIGGERLFGADRVHLTLLSDEGVEWALAPTRSNFEATFRRLADEVKPTDVLVVYLAGHGVALAQGNSSYAYLTQEARSVDPEVLKDTAIRDSSAITGERLAEWTNAIPALKQVLILDTCAAGAARERLMDKRDVSGDQVRAIDRLRGRTGFHVLMGAAADRASYEASRYGQGLLTYALLEGMRGAALRADDTVDVSRLFQYAADRVPVIAGDVGGIQEPMVAAPVGTSFPIGMLTSEERAAVPLRAPVPMLLRPQAMDTGQGFDVRGLRPALAAALRDLTARPDVAGAVYVDADELPGAYCPVVLYRQRGKRLVCEINLVLASEKADSFRLRVPADPDEEAVRAILAAVLGRLPSVPP